tara:strand:+ start:1886 stop:2791 length:906 start_codon:yes stop_codon:yes gene_type:complete
MDNQQPNPEQGRVQRLSHRGVLRCKESIISWETPSINNKIYLYFLEADDQIRYVGITSDPNTRLSHHISDRNSNASHKNSWLKQCISNNIQITMIIKYSFDSYKDALEKEECYINKLDNLTNLELNPTNPKNIACYLYNLKTKHLQHFNSKQSCARSIGVVPSALKAKRIRGLYTCINDSNINNHLYKNHTFKSKCMNTGTIKYFISIQHAAWEFKVNKNMISQVLSLRRKSCKNNLFARKGDDFIKYVNNHIKKIKCVDQNIIFNSIKIAAKYYNLDESCISKVCKGKRNQTGGLKFEYC